MFTLKIAILAPIVLIALYFLFPVIVAAITAPFTKRPKVTLPPASTYGEDLAASVKRAHRM